MGEINVWAGIAAVVKIGAKLNNRQAKKIFKKGGKWVDCPGFLVNGSPAADISVKTLSFGKYDKEPKIARLIERSYGWKFVYAMSKPLTGIRLGEEKGPLDGSAIRAAGIFDAVFENCSFYPGKD